MISSGNVRSRYVNKVEDDVLVLCLPSFNQHASVFDTNPCAQNDHPNLRFDETNLISVVMNDRYEGE